MSGGQPGFWDVQERLRELSARGDPLEKLAVTVDFELFRAVLAAALGSRDRSLYAVPHAQTRRAVTNWSRQNRRQRRSCCQVSIQFRLKYRSAHCP